MACKSYEIMNYRSHIKRFKLRAPYGRVSLIAYYPLFWIWVFGNLLFYKPKIIHACDFDSLIPCYIYRILFSTKLIFDSFDRYAMAFIPPKYRAIYALVNMFEDMLAHKVDALVTVSNERLSTFGKYTPKHTEVISNCPEDKLKMIKRASVSHLHDELILVYAGRITQDRGASILCKAVQDLKDVRLILAGRISDDTIKQLLQNPNISYVGLLPYDEALKLQASADVIPILYDPSVPINRLANPNKLFEAMMLGKPIVSNVKTRLLKKYNCGIVVRYGDIEELKDSIKFLKEHPQKTFEMGMRGREAFEKYFLWEFQRKKLIELYRRLLKDL